MEHSTASAPTNAFNATISAANDQPYSPNDNSGTLVVGGNAAQLRDLIHNSLQRYTGCAKKYPQDNFVFFPKAVTENFAH